MGDCAQSSGMQGANCGILIPYNTASGSLIPPRIFLRIATWIPARRAPTPPSRQNTRRSTQTTTGTRNAAPQLGNQVSFGALGKYRASGCATTCAEPISVEEPCGEYPARTPG